VVPPPARADIARRGRRDHDPAFLTGRLRPGGLACTDAAGGAALNFSSGLPSSPLALEGRDTRTLAIRVALITLFCAERSRLSQ